MYSETVIRDDLTQAAFGYRSQDLKQGSHKFVIVECTNCNAVSRKEFRNSFRKHQCPTVVGDKKRCCSCESWKDLSLFNKNGKLSGGVSKLCKECYNKHEAVVKYEKSRCKRLRDESRDSDYAFYIKRRYASFKRKCENNVSCDLDTDFLISLWEKQQGLCYYTRIPMIGRGTNAGMASWDSPSLDRLIPNVGYIKTNVVWCLNSVNSFKGQLTEEQFKNRLSTINWNFGK